VSWTDSRKSIQERSPQVKSYMRRACSECKENNTDLQTSGEDIEEQNDLLYKMIRYRYGRPYYCQCIEPSRYLSCDSQVQSPEADRTLRGSTLNQKRNVSGFLPNITPARLTMPIAVAISRRTTESAAAYSSCASDSGLASQSEH